MVPVYLKTEESSKINIYTLFSLFLREYNVNKLHYEKVSTTVSDSSFSIYFGSLC